MPKLWNTTLETHRYEVRQAIMETTWALAAEHGPMSVTMARIAQETGIGRATLYKYFPDVETILHAKHQEHVLDHLRRLTALRDRTPDSGERLEAVAHAYAQICHHRAQHGSAELAALAHEAGRVEGAEKELLALFGEMIQAEMTIGNLRTDSTSEELATYCLHALGAASKLTSDAAVKRLVDVVLRGMRP